MMTTLSEAVAALGKEAGATEGELDNLLAGAQQVESSVRDFETAVSRMTESLQAEMTASSPAFDGLRQEMATQGAQLDAAVQRASERLHGIVQGLRAGQQQFTQDSRSLEAAFAELKTTLGALPRTYDETLRNQVAAGDLGLGRLQAGEESLRAGLQEAGDRLTELGSTSAITLNQSGAAIQDLERRLAQAQPTLVGELQAFAQTTRGKVEALKPRFQQIIANQVTPPLAAARDNARERIRHEVDAKTRQLVDRVVNEGLKHVLSGVAQTSTDGEDLVRGLSGMPDKMREAGQKLVWLIDNMSEILRVLGKSITMAIQKKGEQFINWMEEKTGADLGILKDALKAGVTLTNLAIDVGTDLLRLGTDLIFHPDRLGKDLEQTFNHLKEGIRSVKDQAEKALNKAKSAGKKAWKKVKSWF